MRSSLQSDLSAGRESEIEAIGGAVIRRAQEHGLPVPTTIKIVADLYHRQTGQLKAR
jgi:2-dehydropantoate 2-reductase